MQLEESGRLWQQELELNHNRCPNPDTQEGGKQHCQPTKRNVKSTPQEAIGRVPGSSQVMGHRAQVRALPREDQPSGLQGPDQTGRSPRE